MKDVFTKMLDDNKNRRDLDAKRFEESDGDLCMLCHAYGADKRSLWIDCGYAVHEVVPEAIDTFAIPNKEGWSHQNGYYLRICKNCRGALLSKMAEWRNEAIQRRSIPKDHDGSPEESYGDSAELIPVRINGTVVNMTPDAYAEYKKNPIKPKNNSYQL